MNSVETTTLGSRIEQTLELAFRAAGWSVREPEPGPEARDLLVSRGARVYAVECKAAPEGRADRLIPLWSQGYLQARRAAGAHPVLIAVGAPRVSARTAEQVLRFAGDHADDAAAAVVDLEGLRRFRGPGLSGLDAAPLRRRQPRGSAGLRVDLFTDLNQWLLKVLLAPALAEPLLSAPRDTYWGPEDLAKAAGVSPATARRFVKALEAAGHLDTRSLTLRLVRREALFERWRAAAALRVHEAPMRLLAGSDGRKTAERAASAGGACLGLFAAADALDLGLVRGVPPHLYVRHPVKLWKRPREIVPAQPHEQPHLFVRETPASESVFRGAVERKGVLVTDVVQTWLDVSSHPSRGAEQAALIRDEVLERVISEDP